MARSPSSATSIVSVLLVTLLVSGCAETDSGAGPVEFADIHGLAVDPTNPEVLYVATHHGLFQGVEDAAWSKISTATYDLMGFSVHPADPRIMYASGHPENANQAYWALGVIKSADGGRSWQTMALRNQVDFHAMTVSLARPDTLWGHYDGAIYESTDAAASWNTKSANGLPTRVFALASSAADAETLWAATETGLLVSRDAGVSWDPVAGAKDRGAAILVATSRADANVLWAVFAAGGAAYSEDEGASWSEAARIAWESPDPPSALAIDPADKASVYVASIRGSIYKTTDHGSSWTQVK